MFKEQKIASEKGFGIIENLVAISIVSIALVGSTALFATCFHGNAAARTYTGVASDVQRLIDGYRNEPYATLLGRINSNLTSISNGDNSQTSVTVAESNSTYSVTFTAIKSDSEIVPAAVQIQVTATHRRGKFENSQYTYETIVAQVS